MTLYIIKPSENKLEDSYV